MDLFYVFEVMFVVDLLSCFICDWINIVMVVDEFGGIFGFIMMEDILEEFFGEIEDEYDQEEYVECVIEEGQEYIFFGCLEVDYFNEKYYLDLLEGDYYIFFGYIVMQIGIIFE